MIRWISLFIYLHFLLTNANDGQWVREGLTDEKEEKGKS